MNLKNVPQTNSNRAAMHSLKDLLVFFPLILLILQLLTGCGSNSVPLVQSTDPAEQGTVLTQEAPDQIILSEPTLIASQTNSLNTENYWIAWKDPQGNYIAATRAGVPVSLNSGSEGTALNFEPTPIPGPDRPASRDPSPDIFDPPGNPLPDPDPAPPDPPVCEPTPTPEPPDPTPDPEPTPTPDPDPTSTPLPPGPEPCDAREGNGGNRYGCSCFHHVSVWGFGTVYPLNGTPDTSERIGGYACDQELGPGGCPDIITYDYEEEPCPSCDGGTWWVAYIC